MGKPKVDAEEGDGTCSIAIDKEGDKFKYGEETYDTLKAACEAATECVWQGPTDRLCEFGGKTFEVPGWSWDSMCSDSRSYPVYGGGNPHYDYMVDTAPSDAGGNITFMRDEIHPVNDKYYTCTDGVQNGDEIGVDCGATHVRPYGISKEEVCPACSPPPAPPPLPPSPPLSPGESAAGGGAAKAGDETTVSAGHPANLASLVCMLVAAAWLKMF